MKKSTLILFGAAAGILLMTLFSSIRVSATDVTIDANLSVTPTIISFESVFPGEIFYKPLVIALSRGFIADPRLDDVEYHIVQLVKPKLKSDSDYCQSNPTNYERCYPSLCPYLSKEPDGTPPNDKGVAAFHDPTDPTSIALGRLAKSDHDTIDNWTVDLHTPCFWGECDQSGSVPPEYQLDPALRGKKFACDLQVIVDKISCVDGSTIPPPPNPPPPPYVPPCAYPDPVHDLTGHITSQANGTATVTNSSYKCSYLIGFADYKEVDTNIDNQIFFSADVKVIGPKSTVSLKIDVPACAYQQDLFYGDLITSFAGGVRYGSRKLDTNHNETHGFCIGACKGPSIVKTEIHDTYHHDITGGSVVAGTVVHDQAIVSGLGPVPTGKVDFKRFTNGTCDGEPSNIQGGVSLSSGKAESNNFTTVAGALAYIVHYNGDVNYSPSDGVCETLTVTKIQKVEYCSPGFWKQSQHFSSYVGYTPNQLFATVGSPAPSTPPLFANAFPGKTLVGVLSTGGGGLNMLGRATVGALLNASALNSGLTTSQVISIFNAAFAVGTDSAYQSAASQFTAPENCPLGGSGEDDSHKSESH